MTDKAKALVERCKGHTPGPWRWEVNRSHKSVKLCGGSPKHGFGRYDLTVMDFSRYGMNKAAPVFWNWQDGPFLVGDPKRADELAVEVQGREHHANWFADIDHPDAQLVAAAPELLALIETQAREIERLREALKTADAWLDRWARHIGDCPGIDDCTCGLTRVRYEAITALAGDSHDNTIKCGTECPYSHDGFHHVDTSMESGPNNCFHCERPMT